MCIFWHVRVSTPLPEQSSQKSHRWPGSRCWLCRGGGVSGGSPEYFEAVCFVIPTLACVLAVWLIFLVNRVMLEGMEAEVGTRVTLASDLAEEAEGAS